MPVSVTEKASTVAARFRSSLSGLQPLCAAVDVQRHLAVLRELEGVGQQVLDDLLQPLGVGEDRPRQLRSDADDEVDALGLGHVPEGPLDVAVQLVQPQLADVDDHRARLDLRQVENVVDQHQQIVAGRVDRLGELASACGVRLPSGFLDSWSERISRLLSGVRSSCDMLARNSDLYLRSGPAAWPSLPGPAGPARLPGSCVRLPGSGGPAAGPFPAAPGWSFCSSSCRLCSSWASDCDCLSRSSVRMLASIVLSTMPMDSVSCRGTPGASG